MSSSESNSTSIGNEEDYLVVPTGLPSHWTWQDFKDDVRKYVNNQPGWVDIKPSTRPGGGKEGWCRLSQRQDAFAAYDRFAHAGSGVNVHLFATSKKADGTYTLLRCNCDIHFGVAPGSHSPVRSGIDIHAVSQSIFRQQQNLLPVPVVAPVQYAYTYAPYPMAQAYARPHQYAYAQPIPTAVYTAAPNGIPVNVSSGAVLTESRGIFITNLSYSAGTSELRALLNSVGRPLEQQILKDARTGKSKGSATAKFATKEEAQQAVAKLNNAHHMGMTLRVRLDTESTIVGQVQGPVIVNGSTSSRVVQ